MSRRTLCRAVVCRAALVCAALISQGCNPGPPVKPVLVSSAPHSDSRIRQAVGGPKIPPPAALPSLPQPAAQPKITDAAAPRLTLAALAATAADQEPSTASRIDVGPDDLYGKAGPELESLLGAPVLVRREAPAEVWQYRGVHCVLDVVLYAEDAAAPKVSYVEARAHGHPIRKLRPAECLGKFAVARGRAGRIRR